MIPTLWIMHGLPRSGKSTFTKNHADNFSVLELDYYRKLFTGKDYDEDDEPFIWDYVREIAIKLLNDGENVLIDECNSSLYNLAYWITIRNHVNRDIHITIINIKTSPSVCLKRTNDKNMKKVIKRKSNKMISDSDLKSYCNDKKILLINIGES